MVRDKNQQDNSEAGNGSEAGSDAASGGGYGNHAETHQEDEDIDDQDISGSRDFGVQPDQPLTLQESNNTKPSR